MSKCLRAVSYQSVIYHGHLYTLVYFPEKIIQPTNSLLTRLCIQMRSQWVAVVVVMGPPLCPLYAMHTSGHIVQGCQVVREVTRSKFLSVALIHDMIALQH